MFFFEEEEPLVLTTEQQADIARHYENFGFPKSPNRRRYTQIVNLDEIVDRLGGRAIWLDEIEMFPSSGNPMVALTVRIANVLQSYHIWDDRILQRLDVLANSFATAWPGNDYARRYAVDADWHAVNVVRTERTRVAIPSMFRETMAEVADVLAAKGEARPIFCLSFLDFDLHFSIQQAFINVIQHFMDVEELEAFVVADVDVTPVLNITRNQNHFHLVSSEQYLALREALA